MASPNRRAIWAAIADLNRKTPRGFFTIAQIAETAERNSRGAKLRVNISSTMVNHYCTILSLGGFLHKKSAAPLDNQNSRRLQLFFQLIDSKPVEAPVLAKDGSPSMVGRRQENIWRTLRMTKTPMTLIELQAHAATRDLPISPKTISNYIHNLLAADYVKRVAFESGGKTPRFYLPIDKNTGPLPPVITKADLIFDQNRNEIIFAELTGDAPE
ncbi:MAG: hypothetical protein QM523_00520 [Candidatus Pacebacteria bacterium]|nr:hypothetical protein [Candidatus Paceibacterota bacterium]